MIEELAKVYNWMEPHRNDANSHAMIGYETKGSRYIIAIGVLNNYSKQLEVSEALFNLYRVSNQPLRTPLSNIGDMQYTQLLELSEVAAWFESVHRCLVVDQLIAELS